ncbi:ankyrin repeat domain-containing protein 31 isoform X2 [Phyllopteryx taeniolatus]|uniref:ankyrin repeat domain-containing protein 31 isoform X2 n=1 Tax=Phyllopteryx taeniolatus TaxID=161469 RepID=UPI002AD2D4DB|nr:ankyrin repeat domain-containing protein 31 isoform X2 [Phyllopteryx taeniolatus]
MRSQQVSVGHHLTTTTGIHSRANILQKSMTTKARKFQKNMKTSASACSKILPTLKKSSTGTTLKLQVVNRRNRFGETLLHEAVLNGDIQLLKDILKLRPNVNMADHTGRTALHEAALRNQYEACFCLINAGALVNIATRKKVTPLHEAITFGNKRVEELLLKHGAHPLLKTKEEETIFGIPEEGSGQVQVAKIKPKGNRPVDTGGEIIETTNTEQNQDVGMEIHEDVQLHNEEEVQNVGYYQTHHNKALVPKKNQRKTSTIAPLQPSDPSWFPGKKELPHPASQLISTQADTSFFWGLPEEETDSYSDQTVDYLGESSDELVDWAIKTTQDYSSSSIVELANSYTFPTEWFENRAVLQEN